MHNLDTDPVIYDLFEFKPRKGDLKKLEIIKACVECLASEGLENTTYDAIAKRVNTRRAHIAYHFADKYSLYYDAIKFILATYQQLSIEHLKKAKEGNDPLVKYVEAVFLWAKKYPEQMHVMLLFYYFCTLRPEFKQLQAQVRKGGTERVYYILKEKMQMRESSEKLMSLSRNIQNLVGSLVVDVVTTRHQNLDDAKKEAIELVLKLVNCPPSFTKTI